eukprot:9678338-Lingulodinium_polyedra.AAC.1
MPSYGSSSGRGPRVKPRSARRRWPRGGGIGARPGRTRRCGIRVSVEDRESNVVVVGEADGRSHGVVAKPTR